MYIIYRMCDYFPQVLFVEMMWRDTQHPFAKMMRIATCYVLLPFCVCIAQCSSNVFVLHSVQVIRCHEYFA